MPNRDGTGPMGIGRRDGRGRGMRDGRGRGRGGGFFGGKGQGRKTGGQLGNC